MPHYLRIYEEFFETLPDKDVKLLELGIAKVGLYFSGVTTSKKGQS